MTVHESDMTAKPLPLLGETQPERADAARNRCKILDAARRLLAEKGTSALSLVDVAHEAGLGVGTVYRRFGDRSSLLFALLDEGEKRFQAAFTSGPPPLGPGAEPLDRIRAFLHALVDQIADDGELFLEAEANSPTARLRSGPYNVHRLHMSILLNQVRPHANTQYLADALLAPLSATLIEFQRSQQGATYATIKDGIDDLIGWVTHN